MGLAHGLWLVLAATPLPAEGKTIELQAETWFNSLGIQLPDRREYLLFFFSTLEPAAVVDGYLSELEKVRRDKDLAVIGLSPAPPHRVQEFVRERKIRFPVGARSKSHRQFSVKQFPALVSLVPGSPSSPAQWEPLFLDAIGRWAGTIDEEVTLPSTALTDSMPVDLLKQLSREDTDEDQRLRALQILRNKLAPAAFLPWCDQLLEETEDIVDRGRIAYERHLADPQSAAKQPRFPPSAVAARKMLENPNDPTWEPFRQYSEAIETQSADDMLGNFLSHVGDSDSDLLIRREIALEFHSMAESDDPDAKLVAREALMQMLPVEPDAGIRQRIVGGLWATSKPGDFELADFLDQHFQHESDVRAVRPMFEVAIQCLRTGEGPCYDEPE